MHATQTHRIDREQRCGQAGVDPACKGVIGCVGSL
jgi:hypothetical protein